MEREKTYKAHVVVLAYHGQGHINPIVQFSKRLASKGIKITVTTTLTTMKTMQSTSDSITFEHIYNDQTEGGVAGPGGFKGFLDRFEASGSRNLTELIRKHENSEYPVTCLVYDANIPWALNIAKQLGIPGAAFFTQSCAAIAGYYPMHCEVSGETLPLPALSVPGLPQPRVPHLPSLGANTGPYPPIILHILSQFNNIVKADWVLFNSFDRLEEEVVKWMSNLWPVKTIGPCVPSVYLDNRVKNDKDYGFNIYKPNNDACMEWLNSREKGSVVYVSVGSVTSLSAEQMAEMAHALKQNRDWFLWVVKPTEERNLPISFIEETLEKGLVVSWCSQLEVLAHDAVGCFVSHCGWNSSIEALSFGVPVVAVPQFLDQVTNAYYLEQVWGVGIKTKVADEKGLTTTGEEIGRCIGEVMHGEKGVVIRKNATRWKELAKEAIDEGGSSDKCIEEIISRILAT